MNGKAEYSYDHLNRLKEYRPFGVSNGTHYTYYIDNLRKSKDDTYFIWLEGWFIYQTTSNGVESTKVNAKHLSTRNMFDIFSKYNVTTGTSPESIRF